MSNTVLGNKQEYTFYQETHEIELDDDEWIEMEGEIVDEQSIVGFRETCPKASQSTTVQIGFYYKPPDSEWYWDYMYGDPYRPIVPVVFSCNNNGNLTECLNQSFFEVALSNRSEGWVVMNVTLKRALAKNEVVLFGVYSDQLGIAGIDCADADSVSSYYYFSHAYRQNYNSAIAYVSSQAFINQQGKTTCEYYPMIYLEYVNAVESVAYTRTILGNIGASTLLSKRGVYKRNKNITMAAIALIWRKGAYKKNVTTTAGVSEAESRKLLMTRQTESGTTASDNSGRKLRAIRSIQNNGGFSSSYRRMLIKRICNSETVGPTETVQRFLLLIRKLILTKGINDNSTHKANYKKLVLANTENVDAVSKKSQSIRNIESTVDAQTVPFASRLFFRTVQTVSGFWDWIRGKIREANNVMTLFCPIAEELILECKI